MVNLAALTVNVGVSTVNQSSPSLLHPASPDTVKSIVAKTWGKIFSSAKTQSSLIFPAAIMTQSNKKQPGSNLLN